MILQTEIKETLQKCINKSAEALSKEDVTNKDLQNHIKDLINTLSKTNANTIVGDNVKNLEDALTEAETEGLLEEAIGKIYNSAITRNAQDMRNDIETINNNPTQEIEDNEIQNKRVRSDSVVSVS